MSVRIAVKTLEKINATLEADQGASYRQWLGKVIPHIGDAYRGESERHRSHMGASQIGAECARSIWYNFRWVTAKKHEGRLIRLFNRGHLEEARFIALLLAIGCEIYQQDANGNQFRISHADGHFGGSGDGVAIGIPDVPEGTACLTEFKTHGEKSFNDLKAKGVRAAKFEHYVQMQVYMRKMGLAVALYLAVNKNTDELYGEIVLLDVETADQFLSRGEKLVEMNTPPDRISNTSAYYKCRFCDHKPVCFFKATPDVNCRTCQYSKIGSNGTWICVNPIEVDNAAMQGWEDEIELSKESQLEACGNYQLRELYK